MKPGYAVKVMAAEWELLLVFSTLLGLQKYSRKVSKTAENKILLTS